MSGDRAALLVLAFTTFGVIVVIALVLWHRGRIRAMVSRERLAALDRGVQIPWEMDLSRPQPARRLHLKVGVVLIGAGLGLVGASGILMTVAGRTALAWGVFFFVLGLVNVLYDVLVGKQEWERAQVLEEALIRAHIRRLETAAGTTPQGKSPEAGDAGR